jgi:signal transduction histidine kinase/ActR/RegA family two-component response regulator
LTSTDDRLRAILQLQQKARSLEAEIAERKEAEERLRVSLLQEQVARAEAERANHLKDEFLATASHELRTPLNAIIGWSYMLRNSRLDEETITRAVEIIERNAKSQAQLVEDILDVSRVITGKLRLSMEPVDVASAINAAIDSVQLAADSKGIQLEVTLDPSARHVSGDSSRLQQAVWNLLSNAIKFTPAGGRVRVRLERVNSNVQIKVSDTGEGIRPDFLPFIFDRFRQGDGSSTRRHGGLGLGLSIVRHLIELHGGIVHADSAGEGQGTTFTISLPLPISPKPVKSRKTKAEALRSKQGTSVVAKPHASLAGVKVLLVDDDQDTITMLIAMLGEHEAIVQTASSAEAALEIIEWYKPDVLVSDLAMPHEDGYSLINKLRIREAASGKQTPAVALTAYVRVEDRARALSAGFNMFVPKPIEPSELITAIAHLAEVSTTDLILSRPEIM